MAKNHFGVHPQNRSWARLGRDPGSGQIWPGPDSARPRQNCLGRENSLPGQNLLDPGIFGRFSTRAELRGSTGSQNPSLGHGVERIFAGSRICPNPAKLRGSSRYLPWHNSARPPRRHLLDQARVVAQATGHGRLDGGCDRATMLYHVMPKPMDWALEGMWYM